LDQEIIEPENTGGMEEPHSPQESLCDQPSSFPPQFKHGCHNSPGWGKENQSQTTLLLLKECQPPPKIVLKQSLKCNTELLTHWFVKRVKRKLGKLRNAYENLQGASGSKIFYSS